MKLAGIVPVPVAAITAGSACCNSHSMVSPSDLWPSSRVSWNTLAAQRAGIRILRPLPSTFVCRSLVDVLFGGGFLVDEDGMLLLLLSVVGDGDDTDGTMWREAEAVAVVEEAAAAREVEMAREG